MTSPARGSYSRRARRGPLQVVGGVLAVLAVFGSVALFFTDDARLLRLGLVSLLWVAFGSLVALVHFRKDTERAVSRSADQRAVYELELEREVRARREHELATEHEVRQRVTAEVRQEGRVELDELREELKALRENLSLLLSGDLLVERVALRAESTRLRSLTDTARLEAGAPAQLPSTTDRADTLEAETVEHAPEPVAVPHEHEQEPQTAEIETVDPETVDPDPAPVVPAVGATVPEGPGAGAHTAGRSVSDLLAAYGGGSAGAGGRRRRSED